jgi:hypothetical protein
MISSEGYARPPSVLKLIKFRLRWAAMGLITWMMIRLTELWEKI